MAPTPTAQPVLCRGPSLPLLPMCVCVHQVKKLQEVLDEELKGCSIYLVGMMGSGKSTTGKMLANTLK